MSDPITAALINVQGAVCARGEFCLRRGFHAGDGVTGADFLTRSVWESLPLPEEWRDPLVCRHSAASLESHRRCNGACYFLQASATDAELVRLRTGAAPRCTRSVLRAPRVSVPLRATDDHYILYYYYHHCCRARAGRLARFPPALCPVVARGGVDAPASSGDEQRQYGGCRAEPVDGSEKSGACPSAAARPFAAVYHSVDSMSPQRH